jgi:hypothetical protein
VVSCPHQASWHTKTEQKASAIIHSTYSNTQSNTPPFSGNPPSLIKRHSSQFATFHHHHLIITIIKFCFRSVEMYYYNDDDDQELQAPTASSLL